MRTDKHANKTRALGLLGHSVYRAVKSPNIEFLNEIRDLSKSKILTCHTNRCLKDKVQMK